MCITKSADCITVIIFILISLFGTIALVTVTPSTTSCPRMQCAPIISKCQLLDSCRCETGLNFTCYKQCSHCLGDLYSECCSCVDICPKEDENDKSIESHVKLFQTTNEDLYDLFVGYGDATERWTVYNQSITQSNSSIPLNCTMTFLASCLDMYRCESACISMGASGYRWFHIGCCECVGRNCLNFGINQIRCRNCPAEIDQVIDSASDIL